MNPLKGYTNLPKGYIHNVGMQFKKNQKEEISLKIGVKLTALWYTTDAKQKIMLFELFLMLCPFKRKT